MAAIVTATSRTGTVFAAFACYGALWGPYLAMLPEVRHGTGASEAQLGAAMLAGALAAMPAMFLVGRLLDRFGRRVAVATTTMFALVAALPALAGTVPQLILAVALFGFGSGACNVVVVALAATVEAGTGRAVMNRAHALFSVGLLVCTVVTGVARSYGVSGRVVAVTLALVLATVALTARRHVPARLARGRGTTGGRGRLGSAALLLCVLAAFAMVVESGVQQWSAVFLADVLDAPVGLSSAAPGVFAGAMALGRFGGHWLSGRTTDRTVLLVSGGLSGLGVLILAVAEGPAHGLFASALVGGAVSVTTPTVFGLVGRTAAPEDRGATIGSTAALASAGLLLGPALVGQIAGQADLRTAIAALSLVSLAIVLLALRVPTHSLNR